MFLLINNNIWNLIFLLSNLVPTHAAPFSEIVYNLAQKYLKWSSIISGPEMFIMLQFIVP